MASTPDQTFDFVDWISKQWFLILALVTGASHAGRAELRIQRLEKRDEKLDTISTDVTTAKADIAWIKQYLEKQK